MSGQTRRDLVMEHSAMKAASAVFCKSHSETSCKRPGKSLPTKYTKQSLRLFSTEALFFFLALAYWKRVVALVHNFDYDLFPRAYEERGCIQPLLRFLILSYASDPWLPSGSHVCMCIT